jgi:hypothetical protein
MEREKIQNYINNFRRKISPYLKANIGLKTIVYPYDKGIFMSFEFGLNNQNKEEFRGECRNIAEVFQRAKVTSFGGSNSKATFNGTNFIMFENIVNIIKDFDEDEWTDDQASKDVQRILNPKNEQL